MGKGNPYHDPKTGEFTNAPVGTVHLDGLVTVMSAGPRERGVKLPAMTATEATQYVTGNKPRGKYVGDY